MQDFLLTYIWLLGLAVGSFLNVLIYRIPQRISVVKGTSFCPGCRHRLGWLDLIPVFSYLFLRGKCRYCRTPISPRYPAIELLNALCYLAVYAVYGLGWLSVVYAVVCSCLITLSMIDIDTKEIPNRFHLIIGLCAVVAGLLPGNGIGWGDRLIGLFCISLPLLVIALLTGGIGEGDIKLFAVCGLLLGWKLTLLAMLLASVLAGLYGGVLMAVKKASGKTQIPFGPFIALGVMMSLLAGNAILDGYLRWIASVV